MALSILSDPDVKRLLAKLEPSDVSSFCSALDKHAFQAVSIGDEGRYQCHRQVVSRPGASSMLFMPATLPEASSVKVVGVPPPRDPSSSNAQPKPLVGAIMVFDADGRATGLVNAAEITAFRTSLGSILLYRHRAQTRRVVVFGAGKQALWHLRLALVLRGADIESVTVVNRSRRRAQELVDRLRQMDREGYATQSGHVRFSILETGAAAPEAELPPDGLRDAVVDADVIFCTTPSTAPLFPADWLVSERGRGKTRFISAIGSYKLDMQEIDPALLRTVTSRDSPFSGASYHPTNETAGDGGIIVVDTREGCALEAGELVKAGIEEEHIVEVGELTHVLESGERAQQDRLAEWLREGLVIYKSVGMGIMDLVIAGELLQQAASRGIGTSLDEF